MGRPKALRIHPVASLFPEMDEAQYQDLKADIAAHGLQVPVLLAADGRILDGRHRYRACRELGVEPTYVRSKHELEADITREVVSLNLKRRHLDETQRGMVGAELTKLFETEAAARKKQGQARGGSVKPDQTRRGSDNPKASDEGEVTRNGAPKSSSDARRSADDAAALVGCSSRTVQYGTKVLREGIPEVVAAAKRGEIPIAQAASLAQEPPETQQALLSAIRAGQAKNVKDAKRKAKLAQQIQAIEQAPPVVGKCGVLVVDPAWSFDKTREDDPTQRGRTPYPTMTEEQIAGLQLPAADNCVLWLWTTNAHLVTGAATRVLAAWGFTPKALLTWVKPRMGTGDWLRGQTEHCVLAVRGKPVVCPPIPPTVLSAPVGEHSEKPDLFYAMVDRFCPGAKGELFARKPREGWAQFGSDLGSIPAAGAPSGIMPPIVPDPL